MRNSLFKREIANAVSAWRHKHKTGGVPTYVQPVFVAKEKSPADKIYDLISDMCCKGYRFTDSECGIPLIDREDVEDKGEGLYVVRFRCSVDQMRCRQQFDAVAKDVCRETKSGFHFYHKSMEEVYFNKIRLPYEECAWIIQVGELEEEKAKLEQPEQEEEVAVETEDRTDAFESQEEFSLDSAPVPTEKEISKLFAEADEFV